VSWHLETPPSDDICRMQVHACTPGQGPRLVFSALDASVAKELEPAFAAAGHLVISNTRTARMDPAVPLVIPEVNPDHLGLITRQRRERKWSGAIVTNPNCSTIVIALVLAPLRAFGLRSVIVTTLQAVSGAGYPGVASLDILGNIIPSISGEEEKIESETQKILGAYGDDSVTAHTVVLSAQTTRVAVIDGHTVSMSVALDTRPSPDDVKEALRTFSGKPQGLGLPSAPKLAIDVSDAPDRPQPRLDAGKGGGMTVTVGRVRKCPILGTKLLAMGHNTIRGAAGAALLNAELMLADGWVD
jgi:aspartate-semialdehyde dehydrogenase